MDPPLGLQMQSLGRELNTVLARFHAVSRHAPSLAAAPDGSLEAVPCSVIDSWEVQLQKRLDACELDKQAAEKIAAGVPTYADNAAAFCATRSCRALSYSYLYYLNLRLLAWPHGMMAHDWTMGAVPNLDDFSDDRLPLALAPCSAE